MVIRLKKWIGDIVKRVWADFLEYRIVLLVFSIYYIFMHVVFHAFCPLVMVTGFPCAGCGMTRAVLFMLTGQFARSWNLNPMALPVILFAVYCLGTRYLFGRKIKGFQTGIILLLILMLCSYAYRMYTVFPNRPPYVYTTGNFLENNLPYYREFLRRLIDI